MSRRQDGWVGISEVLLFVCVGFFSSASRVSAATVPLTFSEAPGAPFSYASGIPFSRGTLTSLTSLRVDDAGGREVAAQFVSLATWPDGSQKSVLVILNDEAAPSQTYTLQYGAGVTRASYPTPLTYTEDATGITIATGPVQFRLSKSRFTVFDQVWADANTNGIFEATEQLLSQPGDLFFLNAFDNLEYRSSLYPTPTYTLEEQGPMRIVLKASGKLQATNGQALTNFIVRITAYAGRDYVQVEYTLVDPRTESDVTASRSQLALSAIGYGLRLPINLASPTYTFGGENGQRYTGAVTGEHYLYQHGQMNFANGTLNPFTFAYEGVGSGAKAPGWMDISSAQSGISVMLKNYWQQFPKELAINNNQIVVSLHPTRAASPAPDLSYPPLDGTTKQYVRPNTFYFPREGGAKTYQVLFQFHPGIANVTKLDALNQTFQMPPLLTAPATWYTNSKVFGNLVEAGPWSAGYDQYLIDGIYNPSVAAKQDTGGLAVMYGWRDFGDRMRAGWAAVSSNGVQIPSFYNDTHVGAHNFFIQYLRTKDRRWWNLGEISSRHWMDIDVSHANRLGYWRQGLNYVGFGPGEAHVIKHEVVDHDDPHLHWGHAHLSGLPDYYLLTGDRRALEVVQEVGTWWANAAPVFYPTPVSNPHWAEAERDYAWPLFVLNEAFRATGDQKYLQAAAQIVRHLIGWWQTPSDHWVNGVNMGRNDPALGTGWWYMYPAQDNSPWPTGSQTLYNGTNPWMAGALLSAITQFYELNRDVNYVDGATIKEMLLQTMNYVVKNGWEASLRYQPYPYFIYSEANRTIDGGKNHLLFPLAYLWQVYQAGGLSNPAWYDTTALWNTITQAAYADWQVVKWRDTTSQGFYGYELIYPSDFFAIMKNQSLSTSTTPSPLPVPAPTNQPPTLATIGNQTVSEGQTLTFTVVGSDPDGNALTYSTGLLPTGAAFDPTTHAFTWTPGFTQAGSYTITFTVTDTGGLSASQSIPISVLNTNRPPILAPIGNKTASTGKLLSFTISGSDPDGDPLSYSASAAGALPAGAVFDTATRTFTWTPSTTQVGSYPVSFTVSDGSLQDLQTITITVQNTNQPPVLSPISAQTVTAGALLAFTVSATDPDGDPLAYSTGTLPTGAVFDPLTQRFTWTPSANQAGAYFVTISVNDGIHFVAQAVSITVLAATNRPPVLSSLNNQTVQENQLLSFTVSASDPDGDPLTYSTGTLPSGAAFDPATHVFTWTPGFDQAGGYSASFTVTDTGGLSVSQPITITVLNVDRAPILAPIGDKTVSVGQPLSFTLSASDPDGDPLSYSAAAAAGALPAGAAFDPLTHAFTWTPGATQAGSYPVSFTVSDGTLSASQGIRITVVATVNRPPTLSILGSQMVNEGQSVSLQVSATDPDGDPVTLSASQLPAGATFTPLTGVFQWTPSATQAGMYPGVTFQASDGTLTNSVSMTLTVQEKILTLGGTITTSAGAPLANWSVSLTLSDQLVQSGRTDANGHYQFEKLTNRKSYTVRPTRPKNGSFSPSNNQRIAMGTTDNLQVNFKKQ